MQSVQRAIDDRNAAAARVGTRTGHANAPALDASVDVARERLRRLRAVARDSVMWDPTAFHRSTPTTLHRTPDVARPAPPPWTMLHMCHVPSSLVAAAEDVDEGGARFVEDGAQANGNSVGVAGSSTSRRVRAYVDFHATDPYNNGNGGRPMPLAVNVALIAFSRLAAKHVTHNFAFPRIQTSLGMESAIAISKRRRWTMKRRL